MIATRIGEIENIINGPEGAAGILLEYQRDTELFTRSLQEAMADMLDTSERKSYAYTAKKKSEMYSMDKVVRDYAAIYDRLLNSQEAVVRREYA